MIGQRKIRALNKTKGFKLEEGRFSLGTKKKLFTASVGETLEQVAPRSWGCPIPQGQAGLGFEQPYLM